MPIPNFCLWNCHGDSKGRSLEFGIPIDKPCFLSIFSSLAFGIQNSELLPMESPWQFHEQKFEIGISMDRSLGPQNLFKFYVFASHPPMLLNVVETCYVEFIQFQFLQRHNIKPIFDIYVDDLSNLRLISDRNRNPNQKDYYI